MTQRPPVIHFPLTPEARSGAVACGKPPPVDSVAYDPEAVTCKNCLRRLPKAPELVEFVATFHDNPNIDACPECLPAVAEILDANPDKEPAELDLPPCEFCDGLRLVYVQRAAETSP